MSGDHSKLMYYRKELNGKTTRLTIWNRITLNAWEMCFGKTTNGTDTELFQQDKHCKTWNFFVDKQIESLVWRAK